MITKYLIAIVAIVSLIAGSAGTIVINKSLKPIIKVEEKVVNLKCPEVKPCNGIDYDKIKSRNVTIQNTQYITANGDSLVLKKQLDDTRAMLEEVLSKLKVSRCK